MIDKIRIASSMLINNPDMKIPDILDKTEELETAIFSRLWVYPQTCNKCGGKITITDLTTTDDPQFRVSCSCNNARGDSLKSVFIKYLGIENV